MHVAVVHLTSVGATAYFMILSHELYFTSAARRIGRTTTTTTTVYHCTVVHALRSTRCAPRAALHAALHALRSTRCAPRAALHALRSTRCAPRCAPCAALHALRSSLRSMRCAPRAALDVRLVTHRWWQPAASAAGAWLPAWHAAGARWLRSPCDLQPDEPSQTRTPGRRVCERRLPS